MTDAQAEQLRKSRERIDSSLVRLQKRSQAGFYSVAGTIGALIGLLLGGLAVAIAQFALNATGSRIGSESFTSALVTGLGLGIYASTLGTALFLAMSQHHRRPMRPAPLLVMAVSGFATGAVCGGIAQLVVNGITGSQHGASPIVITAASILVGTLLGLALSLNVPNLPPIRGLIVGLVAGLISGLSSAAAVGWGVATAGSYLFGFAAMGAALGFGIALIDRHFRDSVVEIEWEPHSTTRIALGPKPLRIGGGKDHIFIPGAPEHLSNISVRDGQVEHVETASGKRTELKDGSRLRIGGITMVVRTPHDRLPQPGNDRQRN